MQLLEILRHLSIRVVGIARGNEANVTVIITVDVELLCQIRGTQGTKTQASASGG